MEQEEAYKEALAALQELEQSSLNGDYLEKMKALAKQSIELEFEKCMKALVARKQALLSEMELRFQAESQHTTISIKGCKETVQAGATLYSVNKDAALVNWKTATTLKPKNPGVTLISIHFPVSLVEGISKHGSVVEVHGHAPFTRVGFVSTVAGSTCGNVDGSGVEAKFAHIFFGCHNVTDHCLYVSDYGNHTIRKVTTQGGVHTFATKNGDNQLKHPGGIVHYHKENCFFVCSQAQHTIKQISSSGTITVFAGSGSAGSADGTGANASFYYPWGLAIDQQTGSLFVSDQGNYSIRKITAQGCTVSRTKLTTHAGEVSTLAGTGKAGYSDGIGKSAAFSDPYGICFVEKETALVICDRYNNKLRRLNLSDGEVSTMCDIDKPTGISLTLNGSNFIVASMSNKIFLVTLKGAKYEAIPIAGSGNAGCEDGAPFVSKFNEPRGVAFDSKTNTCFVFDANYKVRKFTLI